MKLELVKDDKKVSLSMDDEVTEIKGEEVGRKAFMVLAAMIGRFMKSEGEGSLVIKVDGVLTVESGE